MAENSKIQWTHHTFNAWIGCTKVSAGCTNCYASVDTYPRVQRARGRELWGPKADRHVTSEANWRKPLAWNRAAAEAGERHRVFCASMADVFEDRRDLAVPRERLWRLIEETAHLDWLLLTKRPDVMRRLWPWSSAQANVWALTTVEDQEQAERRIPDLLEVPAVVHGLSVEPMLGPVEFSDVTKRSDAVKQLGKPALDGIDWIIVGSESGPGARPMEVAWARSVVEQCAAAGVACFVKQIATPEGRVARDRKGGDPKHWPPGDWPRQFPQPRADARREDRR